MPAFAGCQFAITVYVSGFAGIPAHFSRRDAESQGKAFLEYVCRFSAVLCVPAPLREMILSGRISFSARDSFWILTTFTRRGTLCHNSQI